MMMTLLPSGENLKPSTLPEVLLSWRRALPSLSIDHISPPARYAMRPLTHLGSVSLPAAVVS